MGSTLWMDQNQSASTYCQNGRIFMWLGEKYLLSFSYQCARNCWARDFSLDNSMPNSEKLVLLKSSLYTQSNWGSEKFTYPKLHSYQAAEQRLKPSSGLQSSDIYSLIFFLVSLYKSFHGWVVLRTNSISFAFLCLVLYSTHYLGLSLRRQAGERGGSSRQSQWKSNSWSILGN